MKSIKRIELIVLIALYVWSCGITCEALALPNFTNGGSWQSRGIGGGGALFSATMSPHDSRVMYIATDMTSVFKTDTFGKNWNTIDFRELQGGIGSHVRFTSDTSTLYAISLANDQRIPQKSVDGGKTWSALTSDPTDGDAWSLYADPNLTDVLILGGWDALYFSSDGGSSFSTAYTAASSDAGLLIAGAFWDGKNVYVGTQDGLLISSDGGTSFALSSVSGIPTDEAMVTFAGAKENGGIRFFTVTVESSASYPGVTGEAIWNYQGIYRLDWGQGSWVKTTSGIESGDQFFFVGMALNDIDSAYVAGGNTDQGTPIVYTTTNGGTSWSEVFLTENNQNIATGWCGDGGDLEWWWAEYPFGFAVSPNDPKRAIITDFGFAHVTDDGGISWSQAYVDSLYENTAGSETPKGEYYRGIGLEDTSCWWIHWTGQSTLIVAFTDIYGIRSDDKGLTWVSGFSFGLPHPNTYHIIEHPTTGTVYAATSDVHDIYEWSSYLEDTRIDSGTGSVVMSADGGKSWNTLKDFGHPVIWLAIDPSNSDTMYASVVHSTEGGIYVTRNLSSGSAASWSRLTSPNRTEGHPFNIQVLNDGTLLTTYSGRINSAGAFTESAGVFVSTDSGTTWEDRSDSQMRRWTKDVVVAPHDSNQNTWYVSVYSHWGSSPDEAGGLYRTTDRGTSWTRISDLYRVGSVAIHPNNKDVLYLSTETQGLWRTDNLSAASPTFTQVTDYPFSHPLRIFFNPSNYNEIWVTSFGGGLRVYDSSASSTTTTAETSTTTTSGSTTTTVGVCLTEELYGEHSEEVKRLRYIRDNVLSQTPEGQELINIYYEWSPAIVKAINENGELKVNVKEMMDGVLELSE